MIFKNLYPKIALTSPKWSILMDLWNQTNFKSVKFTQDERGWVIQEYLKEDLIFQMKRDPITSKRLTDLDTYGLLGVSLLNLESPKVILTEGVSDYFTAKLNNPSENVLGVTNIGGSRIAKTVIVSLFSFVLIEADNDATGITNAVRWKDFLLKYDIFSKIEIPNLKDITDDFLFNLKLNYSV